MSSTWATAKTHDSDHPHMAVTLVILVTPVTSEQEHAAEVPNGQHLLITKATAKTHDSDHPHRTVTQVILVTPSSDPAAY
jgi:hypothetical protein